MSSPTSASSSAVSNDDALAQQTKDKRRERNRLAAQKHRLRRNQRMSQLEQQVLALQQEKNALLSRVDPSAVISIPTPPVDTLDDESWLDDDLDIIDSPKRKRSRMTTDSLAPGDLRPGSPHELHLNGDIRKFTGRKSLVSSPAQEFTPSSSQNGSLPPPSAVSSTNGHLTSSRAESSSSEYEPRQPLRHGRADGVRDAHTIRLEERILELERWTEDLNGSLNEALEAEDNLKVQLETQRRHAEVERQRYTETLQAYQVENGAKQREIDRLRQRLDEAPETNSEHIIADLQSRLRSDAAVIQQQKAEIMRLKEMLDSSEITMELQRRANETLQRPSSRESRRSAYEDRTSPTIHRQENYLDDTYALRKELDMAGDDVANLRWELRQLRDKTLHWEDLVGRLDRLKQALQTTTDDKVRCVEEKKAVEAEARSLRERLHDLVNGEDGRRAFLHEKSKHDDEKAALESDKVVLERENQQLAEKVRSLAGNLEKLREYLQSKGIDME